jgi:hypothetical protein
MQQMLKRPTFKEIIRLFEVGNRDLSSLSVEVLAPIIQKHVELNETTARRRASTVMSWLRWMVAGMEFE